MNEYISRKEAINVIKSLESSMPAKDNYAKGYDAALGRALIAVREVSPAAEVQPIKHGRWIGINEYCKKNGYIPSGMGIYYWCSECEKEEPKISDYCPNCGARMDGDTE